MRVVYLVIHRQSVVEAAHRIYLTLKDLGIEDEKDQKRMVLVLLLLVVADRAPGKSGSPTQ